MQARIDALEAEVMEHRKKLNTIGNGFIQLIRGPIAEHREVMPRVKPWFIANEAGQTPIAHLSDSVAALVAAAEGQGAAEADADALSAVEQLKANSIAIDRLATAVREIQDVMSRLAPLLDAYETKAGPFAEPKKRASSPGRKGKNQTDWQAVQDALNSGMTSFTVIAKETGIPASTCRDYSKMTPEEVAALPEVAS